MTDRLLSHKSGLRHRHGLPWTQRLLASIGLLLTSPAGRAQSASPPPPPAADSVSEVVIRVGLASSAFRDVNLNDATAAYGLFIRNLIHTHEYEANVQTEIFEDAAAFKVALHRETDELQISSIPAWDYLFIKPPINQVPSFMAVRNGQLGRRFVVLTKRGQGFDRLADLSGQALIELDSITTTAATIWLETELREAGFASTEAFFGPITIANRVANTILPVFFGKQAACLVDEPSFELMKELNPQVEANLQVIARSDRLADVVMCINERGWGHPDQKTKMIAAIPHLRDSPAGRQVLTLFKVDGLVPFKDSELDSLRALRRRWERFSANSPP